MALVSAGVLLTVAVQYVFYLNGTDALIERQSREIDKQIVLNYESYVNSVMETMNNLQAMTRDLDVIRSRDRIREIWTFAMDNRKDIVSVSLRDAAGGSILSTDLPGALASGGASGAAAALASPEIFVFETLSPAVSDAAAVRVYKASSCRAGQDLLPCVLSVTLNLRTIGDLAAKTDLGEGGYILLADEDNSLVFSTLSEGSAAAAEALLLAESRHFGGGRARSGSRSLYVMVNTVSQTRWRIILGYDITPFVETRARSLLVTVLVTAFVFLLSALAAGIVSLRISRPLGRLERAMEWVENGDFGISAEPGGQREVAALAHAFNRMLEEIRSLMERLVSEQRDKRKSELRALQNQINPHFLYNTLDSIVWLAENGRAADVITTVVALARFFRIGISRGDQFIPVSDEIEHVRNYLTIQKIRYMDRFVYDIEVEEGILPRKIMKLVLQPIVENAINHGIGDDTARVTIRGFADPAGGRTVFEVANTGYGLTEGRIAEIMETLSSPERRGGVGLRNTYQRLKMYYGEGAGIEIESVPDESTTVRIWIPVDNPAEGGNP